MTGPLREAAHETRDAARWLLANSATDANLLGAVSYPFLQLVGTVAIGWMWLRMAMIADKSPDDPFYGGQAGHSTPLCRACAARMWDAAAEDRGWIGNVDGAVARAVCPQLGSEP